MGYRTYHNLTVTTATEEESLSIIAYFRETFEHAKYAFDEEGHAQQDETWHTSEADLQAVSKKYPQHLFLMECEGEGTTDLWHVWVKDGKKQICDVVITYPPFDENLLTD